MQAPAGDPGAVLPSLSEGRPKERPLLQWQANIDGLQVGARLAGFAHQWQSLLRTCRATSTVQEGVGLTFVHRPQLTHHSITFRTRNSCQDLQQAVNALLSKGAIERVFSRVLQPAVPGAEEDMGSASSRRFVYFESAPGGAALQDGDSGVRSRCRQEPKMDRLHRHKRSLSPCPNAHSLTHSLS